MHQYQFLGHAFVHSPGTFCSLTLESLTLGPYQEGIWIICGSDIVCTDLYSICCLVHVLTVPCLVLVVVLSTVQVTTRWKLSTRWNLFRDPCLYLLCFQHYFIVMSESAKILRQVAEVWPFVGASSRCPWRPHTRPLRGEAQH